MKRISMGLVLTAAMLLPGATARGQPAEMGDPAGSPPVEDERAGVDRSTWRVGGSVTLGRGLPRILVESSCGSTDTSFGLGATGGWWPAALGRWGGVEANLAYLAASSAACEVSGAPLPPEGQRLLREGGLHEPFGSLDARAVLRLPFGPGDLRLFGGPGVAFPDLSPAVVRGVGWVAEAGSMAFVVDYEWWTTRVGGEEILFTWNRETSSRERVGEWDEDVGHRVWRISLRWAVG